MFLFLGGSGGGDSGPPWARALATLVVTVERKVAVEVVTVKEEVAVEVMTVKREMAVEVVTRGDV